MNYPAFYKNGNTYTALLGDNKFIQVKQIGSVFKLAVGHQDWLCHATIIYDKPCPRRDFINAYDLCATTILEFAEIAEPTNEN